ncbi:hypothetical protein [Serratia marcescens]|uniref:hypothetical protein n=1 Tax=Serratia marcescens TaxID=615 RepID=UPI001F1C2080|nr:hypothetical protein [Serratia marcescens]UIM55647.1 hypothetical protein LXH15_00430 [Serratia marcescens]
MEEHDHQAMMCNHHGSGLFPGVRGSTCIPVKPGMTWGQAEDAWIRAYGPNGPVVVGHASDTPGSRECVMFAGQQGLSAPIGQQYNNGELVCVGAPPTPDPLCYIPPIPDIEFSVAPGAITRSASRTARVVCDTAADVLIMSATGLSDITFPWGRARIAMDGAALPGKLHTDPDADFLISVDVAGMGAEPGEYSGSLILVVGYQ